MNTPSGSGDASVAASMEYIVTLENRSQTDGKRKNFKAAAAAAARCVRGLT